MSLYEIWGFTIERSPSGKKIWPNKLKREAARRIREDGSSPGDVAAEIGAHECLVRKWSVADRRSRGEFVAKEEPTFAPVTIAADTDLVPSFGHEKRADDTVKLEHGGFRLEFPASISENSLSVILRAIGQSA